MCRREVVGTVAREVDVSAVGRVSYRHKTARICPGVTWHSALRGPCAKTVGLRYASVANLLVLGDHELACYLPLCETYNDVTHVWIIERIW